MPGRSTSTSRNRGLRRESRSLYVSVLSGIDLHLTLAVLEMGLCAAAAFCLITGVILSAFEKRETQ